jgi:hypothetical protein
VYSQKPAEYLINLADNTFLLMGGGPCEREMRRKHEKPGTFIQRLSPEARELLSNLKSDDLANLRWPPDCFRGFDSLG